MATLLLLHGPNLNLLGSREPQIYGATTLAEINEASQHLCDAAGHQLETLQSNSESVLVERIHLAATSGVNFIVINPAAFTHTSIALRDALAAVAIPFIELHLSNPHARETFRHHSYLSDLARGVICGFGAHSYSLALQAAIHLLDASRLHNNESNCE
ncbi:type II 3-dehydroquinate dehydratase [Microbulbifer sp. OS29]|uniref:3-dehydroquinate dehydratase n=1 Tax=Microbulbifer okhotskensis TaxID=2926617 RepID=A0A9X2EJL2_9GAMM|nr:type II 3-dehydroquinate dehydratase [Microbulbifer okhotskensis]MCO1333442.1 type II 3-dehydroquinate dehydratase [Microbulbifer okhotskensis]